MVYRMNQAEDAMRRIGEVVGAFERKIEAAPSRDGTHQDDSVIKNEQNDNGEIGQRIMLIRDGRPRRLFAGALGISPPTLFRYESGESQPAADVIAKICRLYSVDPRWLLLGEGEPPTSLSASHGGGR